MKSLVLACVVARTVSVNYAVTASPGQISSKAISARTNWFLSADGTLLLSDAYQTVCDDNYNTSTCTSVVDFQWAPLGSSSDTLSFRNIPHRAPNNVYFVFSTEIFNDSTCGPLIFDNGCLNPAGNILPDCDRDSGPVVAPYPLLPAFQNSSCDSLSTILPVSSTSVSPYLSPSGRYLCLIDHNSGPLRVLQRVGGGTSGPFNATPVLSITLPSFSWGGPSQMFACEDDGCLLTPFNDTAALWWVRDASTGLWQQRAVLPLPLDLVPPEYRSCVQIAYLDVSWLGTATDDDALVMGAVWNTGDISCAGVFYEALVVWSSGTPGVNEGGRNEWRNWTATLMREPHPEYHFATVVSAGWVGTTAGGERTFVVLWSNKTRIDAGNFSVPYDEIAVYRVPVNITASAYSAPAMEQSIVCCPPGSLILNSSTGVPLPVQQQNYLNVAPGGSRFVLVTTAFDPVTYVSAGISQLWSDLDRYGPLPTPVPLPVAYPPWIVPTALGATAGCLLAGALAAMIAGRVRRAVLGARTGSGRGIGKPTESSPLLV